jgi:2-hydroxychromene-2-carboxylate isomerase
VSRIAPQFLFDFGSPNAFLSHEAIPAIERRIGVRFEYVPVLLGGIFKATNNRSPASGTSGNFTPSRPSASSGVFRSSPIPGIRSFRSTPSI